MYCSNPSIHYRIDSSIYQSYPSCILSSIYQPHYIIGSTDFHKTAHVNIIYTHIRYMLFLLLIQYPQVQKVRYVIGERPGRYQAVWPVWHHVCNINSNTSAVPLPQEAYLYLYQYVLPLVICHYTILRLNDYDMCFHLNSCVVKAVMSGIVILCQSLSILPF